MITVFCIISMETWVSSLWSLAFHTQIIIFRLKINSHCWFLWSFKIIRSRITPSIFLFYTWVNTPIDTFNCTFIGTSFFFILIFRFFNIESRHSIKPSFCRQNVCFFMLEFFNSFIQSYCILVFFIFDLRFKLLQIVINTVNWFL